VPRVTRLRTANYLSLDFSRRCCAPQSPVGRFFILEPEQFERGGLMPGAVEAHMLHSLCLGIDPEEQIDLARGIEHLFLHLA
jgi:hypothetical protein